MALENVTYINDLNAANPTAADPKSQGDDHLRNIKTAVKNSFPGFEGAVFVAGVDGGSANTYTLTPSHALPAYSEDMIVVFAPAFTNTGASTLNISGLGAKSVKSIAGEDLTSGDLVAGLNYLASYNGTEFHLLDVTKNYIDQLVISGLVPGVSNPANAGKFFTTDGTNGSFVSIDGRGSPVKAKGNTGTTAQSLNYTEGEGQTITATGNHSLTVAGFPSNRLAGMLVKMVNYGAYTLTTAGITWIKSDGTETTTFSSSGITFPSAGTAHVLFFSYGDGTVYAMPGRGV